MSALELDGHRLHATTDELQLICQAISEVVYLLDAPVIPPQLFAPPGDEGTESRQAPVNLSLSRLLPDMSLDPKLAGELRELTEDGLRTAKSERLVKVRTILEQVGDYFEDADSACLVNVPPGEEWQWLGAINDVRLAIAAPRSDPARLVGNMENLAGEPTVRQVYDLLGAWQDSLLGALEDVPSGK
ncbi:MAG: DUF2017 family protein [Varibaculum sp.]|nr:DUF2017 family protein [Varibaculum sp.]